MKKLWISIGVALGLLSASVPAYAQDATPARTSVKDYFFQSKVGDFVDLSTYDPDAANAKIALQFRVELGADLAKGTALKNVFFVGNNETLSAFMGGGVSVMGNTRTLAMTSEADAMGEQIAQLLTTVTVEDDAAERNFTALPTMLLPGMETGFPFLGANMQGLAVSALGGLLFADGSATDANHLPTLSCDKAQTWLTVEKNLIHVYPTNLTNDKILDPTKGDNAPVILALGADDIGMFLWAQFDYMVGDARWLFQIRCYQNGRIDYMTGNDLGQSTLTSDVKGYAFAPTVVAEGKSNSAILAPETKNSSNCWNVLKNNITFTEDGLEIKPDCGPETGRTVSFLPPFDAAAFSLTENPTVASTSLEAKVAFDPSKTPTLAAELVHSICVSITNYKGYGNNCFPKDTPPTTDAKDDYSDLLYVSTPDWKSTMEMPITATDLKPNTDYYIEVYACKYTPGAYAAYSYTELNSFGPFKTQALPDIKDLQATVTDGRIHLTFSPADGLATMVVKSPNATPKTPTGNLAVGGLIGSEFYPQDTVAAFVDAGVSSTELDITEGQGIYLHLYTVVNPETAQALYSAPMTVSAYRPFESLPIEWTLTAASDPGALPLGWHGSDLSEAEDAYKEAAFAFKYANPTSPYYAVGSRNGSLVNGIMSADLITPPFICPENKITVTFDVKFYNATDDWSFSQTEPKDGDSVRIEYRLDGGEWQQAAFFKEFSAADANGYITLSSLITGTRGKKVELRYTRYTATANTANAIFSIRVTPEITCFPPTALTIDLADVTDTQLALRWEDAENTTASYVIAYQESKTKQANTWETVPATGKTGKLTGLKSNTAYRMQVQAICAADDESAFGLPIVFTTYNAIPYTEPLGEVQPDPTSSETEKPVQRGVKTYIGKLGGEWLDEDNGTNTWALSNSSSAKQGEDKSLAMGIHEETTDGILALPKIHTTDTTRLTFTLNSYSAKWNTETGKTDVVYGAVPTEADCQLLVAVSDNGEFTAEDVILTLKGETLNVISKVFEMDVNKTGNLQIAFFFDNPHKQDFGNFYIEVSNLGLKTLPKIYDLALNILPDATAGTVTGEGQYEEGSDVTVTATPAEGYDFVAWMNGSAELSKQASYTFTMPAENITYTAMFKAQPVELEDYELTLTASPANGGRVSGDGIYTEGEEVTISAEANDKFIFVAWLNADNDTLSKEATYTFKMPAKDTAFIARFVPGTANEDLLRANFGISAQDGRLVIRNLDGLTVKSVDVYGLTGNRLHRFTPNSREDLTLPVDARRAMLFVRLETERGAVIYKVYMH